MAVLRSSLLFSAVFFSLCLGQTASATLITLRSGNGPRPGTDSLINMLVGPLDSPFGALTPAQFAAAKAGTPAIIVGPIHPLWKPHLSTDPSAEWISTYFTGASSGATALYAMNFMVPAGPISSAILKFDFLIDNELGDSINEGLFINGTPVPSTKLLGVVLSNFQVDQHFTKDITSLLTPGQNTLYINAVDRGGPSALQFSATINLQHTVPEPATWAIWLVLGNLGVAFAIRRHRRRGEAA